MKRIVFNLVVALLGITIFTACGTPDASNEKVPESQVSESQLIETVEEPVATPVVEENNDSKESKDENLGTDAWTPEEFLRDDAVNIDYTAPAVHTGSGEQCTFLWSYTEDDLKNWFSEKYGSYDGTVKEYVNNTHLKYKSGQRHYNISKKNDATNELAELSIDTGIYNESVAYSVGFAMTSSSQEKIVEEVTAVIEMLGFGEYAEDIIYSDVVFTDVPTENGNGCYRIASGYTVQEYAQNYILRITISYIDAKYCTDDFSGYTAANYESWDNYFSLKDYLKNCEFDTSSLVAFEAEELTFIKDNFDDTYFNKSFEQKFSYYRYDFGEMEKVEFEYHMDRNNSSGDGNGSLIIGYALDGNNCEFKISTYGRQAFEERDEKRWISGGDDLTDAEITELCETRHALMKKLDSSIDWTVEDMIKQYRNAEFKEDNDKIHFEGEGYEYHIMNDLNGLAMYGDFEVKTE